MHNGEPEKIGSHERGAGSPRQAGEVGTTTTTTSENLEVLRTSRRAITRVRETNEQIIKRSPHASVIVGAAFSWQRLLQVHRPLNE